MQANDIHLKKKKKQCSDTNVFSVFKIYNKKVKEKITKDQLLRQMNTSVKPKKILGFDAPIIIN